MLFVVYVFNYVDRQILSIVIEPIKQEFGLHDWQLGVLSGLAFAAFYSTLGIPIARMADTSSRVNIIAASILVWSAFTGVCGLGEQFLAPAVRARRRRHRRSGLQPACVLADQRLLRTEEARDGAVDLLDGRVRRQRDRLAGRRLVAQEYGWRAAFYTVGLPGIALALIVKLTMREPPRGFSDRHAQIVADARRRSARCMIRPVGEEIVPASVARRRPARVRQLRRQLVLLAVPHAHAWHDGRRSGRVRSAFVVAIGGLSGTYLGGAWSAIATTRASRTRAGTCGSRRSR